MTPKKTPYPMIFGIAGIIASFFSPILGFTAGIIGLIGALSQRRKTHFPYKIELILNSLAMISAIIWVIIGIFYYAH